MKKIPLVRYSRRGSRPASGFISRPPGIRGERKKYESNKAMEGIWIRGAQTA